MQNVSRIQKHPDTLIKNFFISGLSQQILRKDIFPENQKDKPQDHFELQPELLFSLYEEPEKIKPYLEQVFLEKITIQQTEKIVDPKFFSFMCTDGDGFNLYNHVLIFYERFTEELIKADFDETAYITRLAHDLERANFKAENNKFLAEFGQKSNFRKLKRLRERVDLIVDSNQGRQNSQEESKADQKMPKEVLELNRAISEHKMRQTEGFRKVPTIVLDGSSASDNDSQKPVKGKNWTKDGALSQVEETAEEHAGSLKTSQRLNLAAVEEEDDNYRDGLFGRTKDEASKNGKSNTSFHKKRKLSSEKRSMNDQTTQASTTQKKSVSFASERQDSMGDKDKAHETLAFEKQGSSNAGRSSGRGSSSKLSSKHNPRLKGEYYFTPIAFVIQTEVEHHDIFKEVLISLFESIRKPKCITENDKDNLQIAFADFLAHLAFLASIPCPTFNTSYHIEFFGKTLTFQEPNFDEVPDKNQIAIRVLFDMLDVRTIMFCWKAILFDFKLVLISSQYSLQFYIAQALLQLLFPLTFQQKCVQPANKDRSGLIKSPWSIIFACSHTVQSFEDIEKTEEKIDVNNKTIAICDVDGSFTNNITFPELEDEKRLMRSLSALKNFKGAKFDSAFPEIYQKDLCQSDNNFTREVRDVFRGILDNFLSIIPSQDFFKPVDADEEHVFNNYFDREGYINWFQGTKDEAFAERLLDSQMFASFCDDFFDTDVSNMLVYMNINQNGYDFTKSDQKLQKAFDERMAIISKELEACIKELRCSENCDEDQPQNPQDKPSSAATEESKQGKLPQECCNGNKSDIKTYSEILRSKDEFAAMMRGGDCEEIKEWPLQEKIDICWRMPQDNQRVMIFEKLQYAVKCYEHERKCHLRNCDFLSEVAGTQEIEQMHDMQMMQLDASIRNLKKLYEQSLDEYGNQVRRAKKDLVRNEQTDTASIDPTGAKAELGQEEFTLQRTQTGYEKRGVPMTNQKMTKTLSDKDDLASLKAKIKEETSEMSSEAGLSGNKMQTEADPILVKALNKIESEQRYKRQASCKGSDVASDMVTFEQNPTRDRENSASDFQNPLGSKDDITPKQKSLYQKRGAPIEVPGFLAATQELELNKSNSEFSSIKEYESAEVLRAKFWQQRQANKHHYSGNRIVEFCYGHHGLILFLDLLFTMFPSKRQTKAKFNYYFALRKQISTIESQIQDELNENFNSESKHIEEWYNARRRLIEYLMPQKSVQSEEFKVQEGQPELPELARSPTNHYKSTAIVMSKHIDEINTRGSLTAMWDMQNNVYNPLEIKGDQLEIFKRRDVKPDVWMLPVLKEKVEVEEDSGEFLSDVQKLLAFRTSYQYISLKQKLYFAFEDQEEAVQLIFGEFLLYSQRDRQIFPKARFHELLEKMTQPQKDRIFKLIMHRMGDSPIFQLRYMFEHEIQGIDADKDEPSSLDHNLYNKDYLKIYHDTKLKMKKSMELPDKTTRTTLTNQNPQPSNQKQMDAKQRQKMNDLSQSIKSKAKQNKKESQSKFSKHIRKISNIIGQSQDMCSTDTKAKGEPASAPAQNIGLTVSQSEIAGQAVWDINNSVVNTTRGTAVTASKVDKESFYNRFDSKEPIVDANERVLKLLERLLIIYWEFFEKGFYDEAEEKLRINAEGKAHKEKLVQALMELRKKVTKKLSSGEIIFVNMLATEESAKELEIIKRCFWTNLFNFLGLQKMIEILIVRPNDLKKQLVNCSMFISFIMSNEIVINEEKITGYEIWRTLLKHQDIQLMSGPFEEPYRQLHEFPQSIRDLALKETHPQGNFGIYIPIKKWGDLCMFEKHRFEDQIRKVTQQALDKVQIDPENFLIRIPKYFFWRLRDENDEIVRSSSSNLDRSRVTTAIVENVGGGQYDAIAILRQMIDQQIISEGKVKDNILAVLNQIQNEMKDSSYMNTSGETTSHMFEIDSFWWKFDIQSLRRSVWNLFKNSKNKKFRQVWKDQFISSSGSFLGISQNSGLAPAAENKKK